MTSGVQEEKIVARFTFHPHTITTRASRQLAPRLAAYLPYTLTRRILEHGLPTPGEAEWLNVAAIFADLTGFTAMSEELAKDGGRGAEELNRTLLMTFTAMMNAIHGAGGAVCHFHGDAMLIFFVDDDEQAASRALACAQFMQSLMLTRQQVNARRKTGPLPSGSVTTFDLSIKCGVGYGRCLQMVVGDPQNSLEFVLGGTAVNTAASAQQQAEPGQVVASAEVLHKAGLSAEGAYRVVKEVTPVPSENTAIYWDAFSPETLHRLLSTAPAFIPSALYERLKDTSTHGLAEHRPITSMFVRFEGIDFANPNAGQQLQQYYEWARSVVARFGGINSHLNRVLTGDKGNHLHIIFGAPVAPDAPEQAIQCAMALQRERLSYITRQQIGLTNGRAFACAVGSQNRREYTVVGRVVNLASRLTQLCPDGQVYIDETTAKRVQDTIELESLPAQTFKGFQKPIAIYQVLRARLTRSQLQQRFGVAQAALLGRTAELAMLTRHMDKALDQKGNVVAISGALGSGQGRFLGAGVRYWLAHGGIGYVGMGQRQMSEVPFGIWKNVWRDFFELNGELGAIAWEAAITKKLKLLFPSMAQSGIALWLSMLGMGYEPDDSHQAQLFDLIAMTLQQTAKERPLLIVLEDVHLADAPSMSLVNHLARTINNDAIMLLLTHRTSTIQGKYRTIALTDLTPQRAKAVIRETFGLDKFPTEIEQRLGLQQETPINPLFLTEMLKMMQEQGVLVRENNGRYTFDQKLLSQMQIPDTLYALSLTRLDRLSPMNRNLLQVASVLGREFTWETLTAVVPETNPSQLGKAFQELEQAGMVQALDSNSEGLSFIFRESLTHTAVYQSVPYSRRQRLHAAIATRLAEWHAHNPRPIASTLAHHYSFTERHEEGLHYALMAAEDASALSANREAAELYQIALKHLQATGEEDEWQTAVHIHLARAKALRHTGHFTQAITSGATALRLRQKYGAPTASAYNLMAEVRYYQARYEDVITLLHHILQTEEVAPEQRIRAQILNALATSTQFAYEEAIQQLNNIKAPSTALRADVEAAKAVIMVEHAHFEEAMPILHQALKASGAKSSHLGLIFGELARLMLLQGNPEDALTSATRGMELTQSVSQNLYARLALDKASALLYLGRLSQARTTLDEAIGLLEKMEDSSTLIHAYLLWGFEYARLSEDWQVAEAALERVVPLLPKEPADNLLYAGYQIRCWLGLGQVAWHKKQPDIARNWFYKASALVDHHHLTWWRPLVLYFKGLATQDLSEAHRLFTVAATAVSNAASPDEKPLILLQLAQTASDPQRQLVYLAKCVQAVEKRGRYMDRIYCFRVAGPLLANANHAEWQTIGQRCLTLVNWFDRKVKHVK